MQQSSGIKQLIVFACVALAGLAVSFFTPVRDYLTVDAIQGFSSQLGAWGPLLLIVVGALSPLAFLPRWPVCFIAGMLYGIAWGTLIGNIAGICGAGLHFLSARALVSTSSTRILERFGLDPERFKSTKVFWVVFLLRAFPLSNSAATNVLAGALRISVPTFLLSSFLGMIPSSAMYAAWGKLLKKPDPHFYAVAVGILVVMIAGTFLAKRYLFPSSETGGNHTRQGEA